MKTIYFEKNYGVKIDDIKNTEEIDHIIEKKIGRSLRVVKKDCSITSTGGCIFDIRRYDIDKRLDEQLKY